MTTKPTIGEQVAQVTVADDLPSFREILASAIDRELASLLESHAELIAVATTICQGLHDYEMEHELTLGNCPKFNVVWLRGACEPLFAALARARKAISRDPTSGRGASPAPESAARRRDAS